ncbi:hypothetical protein RB4924 [Rhodopirellula baltica SH 1]|uniref:Uncharacterized protein n=1 Tax=Rhodopirellula baltica (strain DSM 10527 / NCIMB 13988 / SH1) TaxID=243090 RepID=Q7UGZ8_RHOBA|nr:hypothetical protein RB4924 [Rhodopirellula baltica SH 1]
MIVIRVNRLRQFGVTAEAGLRVATSFLHCDSDAVFIALAPSN